MTSSPTPRSPAERGSDLVSAALLGTDRRPATGATDPTRTLLDQAARERAAALLEMGFERCPTAPAAPPVDVADPPPTARELLSEILLGPGTSALDLWLVEALDHGCGLAPEHWTAVLERARRPPELNQHRLAAALGARGRWFARQNPAWRSTSRRWDRAAPDPSAVPPPERPPSETDRLLAVPDPWPEPIRRTALDLLAAGTLSPQQASTFGAACGARLRLADYPRVADAIGRAERRVPAGRGSGRPWWPPHPPPVPRNAGSPRAGLGAVEDALWTRLRLARAFDPATTAPSRRVTFTPEQGRAPMTTEAAVLRPHAEHAFTAELEALAAFDDRPRPPQWRLSPWAVVRYLMGTTLPDGTMVSAKYIGSQRLMEVAVATLATDRALLLLGVPGTAKSWVSEHLAAAVSGDSTLLVQGTSGTAEEAIRYGWNYARLLAEGPSAAALVPSPVMVAMERGALARVEELTRIPSDVQDALITVLSEKVLPVPELGREVSARRGFNLIATANDRDRGINELSSALRRRFNTVVLPLPADAEDEVRIVSTRVADLTASLELPPVPAAAEEIRRVVMVFRELRSGVSADGRTRIKSPSATLSAAEAISVITSGVALAAHFGDSVLRPGDIAAGLVGAVVKDPVADAVAWNEYLEVVVRERDGWGAFYTACRDLS